MCNEGSLSSTHLDEGPGRQIECGFGSREGLQCTSVSWKSTADLVKDTSNNS